MTPLTFNEWRKINRPALRRVTPVGITHNGGRQRIYGCICGASISMCAKWPMTKRVSDFVDAHNVSCVPAECRVRA